MDIKDNNYSNYCKLLQAIKKIDLDESIIKKDYMFDLSSIEIERNEKKIKNKKESI